MAKRDCCRNGNHNIKSISHVIIVSVGTLELVLSELPLTRAAIKNTSLMPQGAVMFSGLYGPADFPTSCVVMSVEIALLWPALRSNKCNCCIDAT